MRNTHSGGHRTNERGYEAIMGGSGVQAPLLPADHHRLPEHTGSIDEFATVKICL
jgi:hypothetical protein